ncbi:TRAP transporter large permease [Effusibacillus lacus]|uniref:C4-dicarboxylate ABC transporter permease n=1 Tax=Effusibacillus lacus TaxID=1348429 RepID=A0A292YJZ6_9BACL|nr:TRAP transporter large permease [Effusibacillus lacus]TCS68597.1 C4-dicarboxylate transporter DctM subunit [Effusibacillus lacus]GAX88815.1 C4-dicarboxylate ABC transporter permease [Effusibacillus lacus]
MEVIAIASLFVLLLIGLPIAFALSLAGLFMLYLLVNNPKVYSAVPQMMFDSVDSFLLTSIPFFLLASELLIVAGVIQYLIKGIDSLIGHWRGGLFTVSVLATAFFAAITGSSSATLVAIGSVLIPEMIRKGYNPKHVMGIFAVAGGLGIVIPPSIPMIVYGSVAEVSVGKLFMAGFVPGALIAIGLIIMGLFVTSKEKIQLPSKANWTERRTALKNSIWIVLMPLFIAIGIYGGFFTPTEAAAVSAVYAFLIGHFVYGGLNLARFWEATRKSVESTSMILLIIAGASVFGFVLSLLQIPQTLTNAVVGLNMTPYTFLLMVNLLLLVLGCFLDITSILLLTAPIIIPIMNQLGIDPVHFGIIFVLNMELALLTPPLGMNLFIVSNITNQPIETVLRGSIPFSSVMVIVLLAVIFIPYLSLMLVR